MQTVTRWFSLAAVVVLAFSACSVIRGDKTAGTAVDDTTLTARVKTALAGDPTASATRVDVDVNDGRVTLTGTARTSEEARSARDVASRVPGVKSVENHIHVAQAGSDRDTG